MVTRVEELGRKEQWENERLMQYALSLAYLFIYLTFTYIFSNTFAPIMTVNKAHSEDYLGSRGMVSVHDVRILVHLSRGPQNRPFEVRTESTRAFQNYVTAARFLKRYISISEH